MTLEQAMERLARIKTVEGLARFLKREGITGLKCDVWHCPVAHWLQQATGRDFFGNAHQFQIGLEAPCRTPDVVAEFIHTFDRGKKYRYLQA